MTSIEEFIELNRQQAKQIISLQSRVDELMNEVVLLREENYQLKDEIATLKGQKPRPKIPPSLLEGAKSSNCSKS